MPNHPPTAPSDRSDARVLDQLARVHRVCLATVMVIAVITLAAWLITGAGVKLPLVFTLTKANTAVALLAAAISLALSQPHRRGKSVLLSRALAVLVGLVGVTSLLEHAFAISLGMDTLIAADAGSFHPGRMSPQSGSSFALLGFVLFFIRERKGLTRHIADLFVVGLSVLVLIVVSGYLFGTISLFTIAPSNWTAPQTLLSLAMLSFVSFGIRAEYGAFGIILGRGIGSRIARILTPILVLLPFLREVGRARMLRSHLLPEHYATAILASMAALLSFVLLVLLARHINGMEDEIHDLSLRDGLTGLYNLRGFHLLAEQALRLAQRAQLPFSVLFVDLDYLKQINDELGHNIGSSYLVETGALLQSAFRETDVIGRIGGDEFAVAGQFSYAGISKAARRLEEVSESATPDFESRFPLSLSIGHVTTEYGGRETLEDLLARADRAMYEHKKGKRLQAR
jgi:diguanylate cyclase (GGDEF)-like protein